VVARAPLARRWDAPVPGPDRPRGPQAKRGGGGAATASARAAAPSPQQRRPRIRRSARDGRQMGPDTTPRLKTHIGHLPQGPHSPILTNYRGDTTSWPFVAAFTCPDDSVNAAPSLTHLFHRDYASADPRGDEDVATSRISQRDAGIPCACSQSQESAEGRPPTA